MMACKRKSSHALKCIKLLQFLTQKKNYVVESQKIKKEFFLFLVKIQNLNEENVLEVT